MSRPILPHHPSAASPEIARLVKLAEAERAVVDAAFAETNAEDHLNTLTGALTAPRGDPSIQARNNAVIARQTAHNERREAVRRLRELRAQP